MILSDTQIEAMAADPDRRAVYASIKSLIDKLSYHNDVDTIDGLIIAIIDQWASMLNEDPSGINYMIDQDEEDIQTYTKTIKLMASGLEFYWVDHRDNKTCYDIKKALKRLDIPHGWQNNDLWVAPWAKLALEAYFSKSGYADLPIHKYLSKMKPVESCIVTEEEINAASLKLTNIQRKRRYKAPRLKRSMGKFT